VSVVFAGQALRPDETGSATPIPTRGQPVTSAGPTIPTTFEPGFLPGAPVLLPPATTVLTDSEIQLSGELHEALPRDGRFRIRVYINGELLRERRLPRRDRFTLAPIGLQEGSNSITLAISGPSGESLHSAPIVIVRDSTAPAVSVSEPPGGAIYAAVAVVRGTSEPGATLVLTNPANRAEVTQVVADDGTFEAQLPLAMGLNEIALVARDLAGNVGRATLALERREGSTTATLNLSRDHISLAALPVTLTLHARVLDPARQPIDGAEVTFSISPPGLPTQTFVGTTVAGQLVWGGVRISREGAQSGQGLVTMLVVLPSGESIQESAFFTID
jgi:hypothetical protein